MSLIISSEVTDAFQALKMKRKYQWIIMKLSDDGKEVIVEVTETTEKTADSLCAKLPTDDSRFIVWDHKGKIVYILWSPDSASVKAKMTYAQTSQTLYHQLQGIQKQLQASDADGLSNITFP